MKNTWEHRDGASATVGHPPKDSNSRDSHTESRPRNRAPSQIAPPPPSHPPQLPTPASLPASVPCGRLSTPQTYVSPPSSHSARPPPLGRCQRRSPPPPAAPPPRHRHCHHYHHRRHRHRHHCHRHRHCPCHRHCHRRHRHPAPLVQTAAPRTVTAAAASRPRQWRQWRAAARRLTRRWPRRARGHPPTRRRPRPRRRCRRPPSPESARGDATGGGDGIHGRNGRRPWSVLGVVAGGGGRGKGNRAMLHPTQPPSTAGKATATFATAVRLSKRAWTSPKVDSGRG